MRVNCSGGQVESITVIDGDIPRASMVCTIEGGLTAIIDSVSTEIFKIVKEEKKSIEKKQDDSLSSDDDDDGKNNDNDSVFSDE